MGEGWREGRGIRKDKERDGSILGEGEKGMER